MSERIANRCPACGGSTLIVGDGGFLTCGLIGCTDPLAVERVLPHDPQEARQRQEDEEAGRLLRELGAEVYPHAGQWAASIGITETELCPTPVAALRALRDAIGGEG